MAIVYRRIETIDEYRAVEDLQAQVWGSDARDVVPLHLLLTANKNGGLALGAFDPDLTPPDDLIGFVLVSLVSRQRDRSNTVRICWECCRSIVIGGSVRNSSAVSVTSCLRRASR